MNAAGGGGYAGGCFTEEKELKHDCGICVGPYAGIIIFPRVGWILSAAALGALPGMWIFEAGLCFMFFTKSYPRFLALRKRVCCFIMIVMLAYTFSGCGSSHGGQEDFNIEIEDNQYIYRFGEGTIEIDDENNTIIYTDGQGKEIHLLRNVFPLDLTVHNIFVNGEDCYYLLENDNDSGICVRKINMKDFSDVLIFSSIEENIEDFYGLKTEERGAEEIFQDMEETKWFFVSDRYIYLKKKYDIRQINRNSGLQKIVAEQVSDGKVIYNNGKIIYMDANGRQAVYEE